ncbi:twin-arginine translocation pathway signal [hydrocarbon metagenome]|uniref:Twin-arginine translocation pathway signal n=1 Tax=hydrocarbon metagenome TaxID=938273 RepID=A0A0W8E543_9ZZZZ
MNIAPISKWSWERPPLPIPTDEIQITVNADIVVIGAGLAGMVAALSAQEAGAVPIIIEKNWSFSARGYHNAAFDSKVHQKMGIEVDYRQAIRDWIRWSQSKADEVLLWEFARKSGACMDWLVDIAEAGGMQVGIWDGYYKGPDYTEYPVTHMFYVPGKPDISWNYGLSKILEKNIKGKGINIHYNMPAVRLIRDKQGPVTGVIAGKPGHYTQYNASQGVIIATGDYASDMEMLERYNSFALEADAQVYFPQETNVGEGHKIAMWVGAAMQKVEPHSTVIHLEAGAMSYFFLHVNARGKRFKNEDVNTQSKSCGKLLEPGGIAWTVYDANGLADVQKSIAAATGGGLFWDQTERLMGQEWDMEAEQALLEEHIKTGKVVTANTLEDLAKKMKVPAENFVSTVTRYNELADQKDDEDFGKRPDLLTPIARPPFFAGKLLATILTASGGLRTNPNCQVLDDDDEPIKNLYVAGSTAGGFFANDYPTICPGIGHGRCITFGRIAGIIAAGKDIDDMIPSRRI